MDSIALLCTDGSDVSIEALRQSLPLVAPMDRMIVVTVESSVDPELETGIGFSMRSTSDPSAQIATSGDAVAKQILERTTAALGLEDVEQMAIVGRPGHAICELAESLPASIVLIGTSGRGGVRRAMIGSTSDHVVRHAVCPVLVQAVGRH